MALTEVVFDYLLGKAVELAKRTWPRSDEFLQYNAQELLKYYCNQCGRFREDIPYSEEASFFRATWKETVDFATTLNVRCTDPWFQLDQSDPEIAWWQHAAYERMIQCGRVHGEDTIVVRLLKYDNVTNTFDLQRAKYSQQAKSNLVLDWDGSRVGRSFQFGTLRKFLLAKHGHYLPALRETLLTNSVGIAVILLFKAKSGEYLPYLQKRAKGLAVFPGAFHCTASGATRVPLMRSWEKDLFSFGEVFTDDLHDELDAEVGISRQHVQDLTPVALCREYLRGGKPQLFFVGLTDLTSDQLRDARVAAIQRTKSKSELQEIGTRVNVPNDSEEFAKFLQDADITLETLPALYYAEKYAQIRGL